MASFNRIILVGNITRDLDLRTLPSGMPVLDLGLAVNDRRKDSNGNWVDETLFIDVSVWARNAEILAENARKGSPILVEGRLKMDTWETDGQKRTKFKVTADRVVLLGPRPSGGDTSQQAWGGNRGGYQGGYQQGGYSQGGGYQQGGGYSQGGNQYGGYSQGGFSQDAGQGGNSNYSAPDNQFDPPPGGPANTQREDDIPF